MTGIWWDDDAKLRSDDEDLKRWGRKVNRGYRQVYEAALAGVWLDQSGMDWATRQAYIAGRIERRRQRIDDRLVLFAGWLLRTVFGKRRRRRTQ